MSAFEILFFSVYSTRSLVPMFFFFFAKIYRHARDSIYELKKKKKERKKGGKRWKYLMETKARDISRIPRLQMSS